jgi:hypothetical protein
VEGILRFASAGAGLVGVGRDFFKGSLGLAALSSVALAVPGTEVAAQTPGTRPVLDQRPVIARVIPKTKEAVPGIGLGTFMTFDVEPGGRRDNLFEVTRRYWQAGGRVIDNLAALRNGGG